MTANVLPPATNPVAPVAQFGLTPDFGLPALYKLPEGIVLLIFVGTAALGLAYLYKQ